ncbi:MAG: hypothetical protein JSW49_10260 [candidate division WOR-3 bacterium]|nr:MAG: hypothetical protein JSW49_10260 [candidate division WOR-3 bacterium]
MRTRKITDFLVLILASMIMVHSFVRAEENVMKDADKETLEWHKRFAVGCNNRVWSLLAKETRSDEESEEMVHAAHASYYHWSKIGEPVNFQRGEWLISHVYAVLERSEQALHHAVKCLTLTEAHKFMDFDLAYAYEAMARAYAAAHSTTEAKKYLDLARKAGESIKREEDRKIFFSDLEKGPWFGIE